jgi:CheY-like chemotaxis protein
MEAQVLRAQRMENMGALGAGIAHDLNNILSPIIMTLPLLRERLRDQESQELIDMLSSNAQRAAEIVKQMLAFSEGFQGDRTLMDPRHLLRNLGQFILETFPKNIHLDMECEDDSWHIQGDPTLIHQTLLNLCVNARDAMPQGGTLGIRMQNLVLDEYSAGLYAQAKPGNYIVITITDGGTGISPENLGRIFDPFFSTKGPGKGTGLGLATAHIIVKKHGGFFRVESALNRGTTFRIYLPAVVEESELLIVDNTEVPHGNEELILVIDDEEHVGEVVRRALTRFGYRVLVAHDGTEALSQLSQHRQDVQLVISDIVMPVLDGQTTARILKNLKPELKYIFMTGWTDPDKIAPEIAKGQVPLIHKPFNINLLLRKVHEVLQAK